MEAMLEALIPKLEAWIKNTRGALIEDLIALAQIPSVAGQNQGDAPYGSPCARALGAAGEIALRRGFTARNHENQCATLSLPGTGGRTLGIFCHLDVVPEGGGWSHEPYLPFLEDGHVFARGVTDNKGPAVAMLSLLQFLKTEGVPLSHTLLLYLGSNEESGMGDLDWYLERFEPPHLSLTPDASFSVCNGEKGHMTALVSAALPEGIAALEGGSGPNSVPDSAAIVLSACGYALARGQLDESLGVEALLDGVKITAVGLSAHAAFPESGDNAIVKLCRALVESGLLDEPGTRLLSAYGALFGDCHGGGLGVACDDAPSGKLTAVGGTLRTRNGRLEQTLDIRYPVTACRPWLALTLTERVRAMGFELDALQDNPPVYYPERHPVIQLLNDTCNEVLGTDLKPYVIGGGTYARRLPMAVAYGHLLRSRPRPGGPSRGGGHQADECVSIEGLEDLMRVYLRALLRLDGLESESARREWEIETCKE